MQCSIRVLLCRFWFFSSRFDVTNFICILNCGSCSCSKPITMQLEQCSIYEKNDLNIRKSFTLSNFIHKSLKYHVEINLIWYDELQWTVKVPLMMHKKLLTIRFREIFKLNIRISIFSIVTNPCQMKNYFVNVNFKWIVNRGDGMCRAHLLVHKYRMRFTEMIHTKMMLSQCFISAAKLNHGLNIITHHAIYTTHHRNSKNNKHFKLKPFAFMCLRSFFFYFAFTAFGRFTIYNSFILYHISTL